MRGLIVGFGSIGKRHLRNVRQLMPDAELLVYRHQKGSTADPDLALANRVIYRLEDACSGPLDFAVIASPAPFHLKTALFLAKQGVHLLLEKPISNGLEGVDELIEVCRSGGLTLLVGYTLRFHKPLQQVRQSVADGRIGRVLGFRAEVGQFLPDWRKDASYRDSVTARRELGGGVLLELSHELDNARWLIGDITSISAITARVSDLEIDVEDWAELNVRFACGAVGNIHMDMVQRAPNRSCRIVGSDGTLTWEASSNHARLYSARTSQWEDIHPAGPIDRNEMYLEELQHFLACMQGTETPRISGEDGKRALQIALAASESATQGRMIAI